MKSSFAIFFLFLCHRMELTLMMTILNPVRSLLLLSGITTFLLFSDCKKTVAVEEKNSKTGEVPGDGKDDPKNQRQLRDMFGINAYEWNFLSETDGSLIKETNMPVIKSFSGIRHYLDWQKLEFTEGNYTFNPVHDGGWNYDAMYERCKREGILILADIKNIPPWLVSTYPQALQSGYNLPLAHGANRTDPASYIKQAKVAFQFAARYGSNTTIDRTLLKVNSAQRWNGDPINQVKVGLDLVKYIECNNEPDKWWEGDAAEQSAEEYAANLSAFYDGHMGRLGKNVGVKTADPGMTVVIGGLATADAGYVTRMINWCKANRGYKSDGSVNLCFDVINYHYYSNSGDQKAGIAPELSKSASIAESFVKLANSLPNRPPVWITESGYDINPQSLQAAKPIGNKTALITQADWILRSGFLLMRNGIDRSFYYQLFDDTENGPITYMTSGFAVEGKENRPVLDYIRQTTKLMGSYTYVKTINSDPMVDQYQNGTKTMYVLMIPDQKDRRGTYRLATPEKSLNLYNIKVGSDSMTSKLITPTNGFVTIEVTETPVFVGN